MLDWRSSEALFSCTFRERHQAISMVAGNSGLTVNHYGVKPSRLPDLILPVSVLAREYGAFHPDPFR